jgi:hypothetical protein
MNQNYNPVILSDNSETVEKTKPTKNFLIEKCSYCNKEMELVEKTVICGAKWYHSFCWTLINSKDSEKITQIYRTEVCQT